MKLQSWIVIFAIIVIPIVLVMSLYIQVQVSYVNAQGNYDTILNNATYDAIKAFQINELNSTTQNIAEEKIRDVEASVSTFYNSLATNFGRSGYAEDDLKGFIPALVYTLYDGYYIYTEYNNVVTGESLNEDNILTPQINLDSSQSATGLKPYVYYSARYQNGAKDVVINYTLDNYITVFYKGAGDDNYHTYSGYLIDTTKVQERSDGIYYDGIKIDTEALSEVNRTTADDGSNRKLNYAYVTNDSGRREKAYWDGRWYKYNIDGTQNFNDANVRAQLGTTYKQDDSAQRYLREAVTFTNNMQSILGDIYLRNIVGVNQADLGITGDIGNQKLINFGSSGMLDTFNNHKLQVIRNSITTNLKATIAKFNQNTTYAAKMPTLTENEWSLILSNTCLISFMQGQHIGNGYYMGYSIVTNNKNREFVDPKLIYVLDQDSMEYHDVRHIDASLSNNVIGYRNIDFETQSFVSSDSTTKNYYRHMNNEGTSAATADYACIVTSTSITTSNGSSSSDNALGNRITELDDILDRAPDKIKKAYYTALFRERYNSFKSLSLNIS